MFFSICPIRSVRGFFYDNGQDRIGTRELLSADCRKESAALHIQADDRLGVLFLERYSTSVQSASNFLAVQFTSAQWGANFLAVHFTSAQSGVNFQEVHSASAEWGAKFLGIAFYLGIIEFQLFR